MRVTHGCSFETIGGVWRKEYLEADLAEFPEAATLNEDTQVAYVTGRLEQKVLLLRWMFGNLDVEHYHERWGAIDAMCEAWLHPKVAVDAAQPT